MDADFWHKRWRDNQIGFHMSEANPLLVKYFNKLQLAKGSRIFIPLCGKTLDIAWLLSLGYRIAGAELSEAAIKQLFTELDIEPAITLSNNTIHYSAENLDIYVGDIFELSAEKIGSIDAIYDRAAIIALPQPMRIKYTSHLRNITQTAIQLIITYEYDQSLMSGPPFSISEAEINEHYQNYYEITTQQAVNLAPDEKRNFAKKECVYLLK